VGVVRDQNDREATKTFEYLEDTLETSHGVRGSRSGMPADVMARMKDGVIEPKSVLQILELLRHNALRSFGLLCSELVRCLLIGSRVYL
jgi:hypothetical protein